MKIFFLILALFSQLTIAQVRPVPNPGPLPPLPPIDLPMSTLCKKQCSNGVQSLTFMTISSTSKTLNCPERASLVHSCAPYACEPNGAFCKSSCSSNNDCSQGFMCINGTCGVNSYYCQDFSTAAGTNGERFDCAPYACQSGQCLKRCGTTNDCVPGSVCDVGAGLCVHVN